MLQAPRAKSVWWPGTHQFHSGIASFCKWIVNQTARGARPVQGERHRARPVPKTKKPLLLEGPSGPFCEASVPQGRYRPIFASASFSSSPPSWRAFSWPWAWLSWRPSWLFSEPPSSLLLFWPRVWLQALGVDLEAAFGAGATASSGSSSPISNSSSTTSTTSSESPPNSSSSSSPASSLSSSKLSFSRSIPSSPRGILPDDVGAEPLLRPESTVRSKACAVVIVLAGSCQEFCMLTAEDVAAMT